MNLLNNVFYSFSTRMYLALNNQQSLICHKIKIFNQILMARLLIFFQFLYGSKFSISVKAIVCLCENILLEEVFLRFRDLILYV